MSKATDLRKLLTPELHKKVQTRQEECYKIAEKHFKTKIPRPEVRYDIKNYDGGMAKWPSNVIRYNLILLFENEEDFIKQTVPHEVAHLVNRYCNKPAEGKKRLMPHGKEWKTIMKELFGLEPWTKHSYDVSSIQRSPRKKQSSKARVNTAISVIASVLKRVNTKFTREERIRFQREFDRLIDQMNENLQEAA